MQVMFLGKTQINMREFLTLVKNKTGKSLKIDDLRLTQNHSLAYLATLTDFKDVPCNFTNLGSLLRHEHYVYLLHCSERDMTEVIMETDLNIVTDVDNDLAVVSGNLQQWLLAIIVGCSESALDSIRKFMNLVLLDMEQKELGQLWVAYSKVPLKDKTFKLLEKK